MRNVYVVYGPARAGTHYLQNFLSTGINPGGLTNSLSFHYPADLNEILQYEKNIVIHSHDKQVFDDIKIPHNEITVILSIRRDEFARLMSFFIARTASQEWHTYTKKNIDKFYISMVDFFNYINHIDIDNFYNLSYHFKKIIKVYYEDLLFKGPDYLINLLDISKKNVNTENFCLPVRSPYQYKDLVKNWKELKTAHLIYLNTIKKI
jgi:hypothetical protein